jgi:pyrroloquinoline-quinone synthase
MLMEHDEFRASLEDTLHSHLTISHPVFSLLLDEKNPQPEFLQQVALQGYQLTKNFLEYIENLFFYCPLPKHKRRLPATQELIDYRMEAVKDPARYHVGAAAVTIASEGQNLETLGSESRDVLFERVYGLTTKDLLFFSVHQVEDVGHTQQGLDLVADLCVTEKMQQEALYAVSHTCELFYGMYEGIYQEYLAGRLLPA